MKDDTYKRTVELACLAARRVLGMPCRAKADGTLVLTTLDGRRRYVVEPAARAMASPRMRTPMWVTMDPLPATGYERRTMNSNPVDGYPNALALVAGHETRLRTYSTMTGGDLA